MSRQHPVPPAANGGRSTATAPPFPPFPQSQAHSVAAASASGSGPGGSAGPNPNGQDGPNAAGRRPSSHTVAPAPPTSNYSPMSRRGPTSTSTTTSQALGPSQGQGQNFFPLPPVFGSPRREWIDPERERGRDDDRDREREREREKGRNAVLIGYGSPSDLRRTSGSGLPPLSTSAPGPAYPTLPPPASMGMPAPIDHIAGTSTARRPSASSQPHNPYPQPQPQPARPSTQAPPGLPHPNPYIAADRRRLATVTGTSSQTPVTAPPPHAPAGATSGRTVLVQSPEEEDDPEVDDEDNDVDVDMEDGDSIVGAGEDGKAAGQGVAGGAGSSTPAVKKRRPHATRRRAVQSCSECRRRKIKCDKKFPCGPCVLRNDEARCHEVGMAEKNVNASPSNFATASDLAQVAQRLDALESALLKTGTLVPADIDRYFKIYRSGSLGPPRDLPSMSLLEGVDRHPIKMEESNPKPQIQPLQTRTSADPSHSNPERDLVTVTTARSEGGRASGEARRTATATADRDERLDELVRGGDPDHRSRSDVNKKGTIAETARTESTAAAAHVNSGVNAYGGGGGGVVGRASISDGSADGDGDGQDDTEGAALTLEHLAFGRSRVEGAHSIPHFGARIPSSISKHAPNNDYHLARSSVSNVHTHTHTHSGGLAASPMSGSGRALSISASAGNSPADARRKSSLNIMPSSGSGEAQAQVRSHGGGYGVPGQSEGPDRRTSYGESLSVEERQMRIDALLDLIGPTDVFELFYRKTDVAGRALTKMLPSRERGELLVKTYLEKVDWLHRCLHVPTFLRQCHDLWAIPHDMIVHVIAMPFIALYFSVCCLGVQFMDAREANKHFTQDEIRDLPDLWFNAARSSMWAADFVGTHATEHLQSLLLLGVFMNNRDRGEAAWALLGAGIKMAQGLGLSRLGAEPTSADGKVRPMWTGRWESLIQREVGRRIWWNYVFLDWALAPQYNFSCSIHPDQIKTALPANVEDEDIVDGQPLRPRPPHVRTGMSFTLGRVRFSEIAYRQIREANTHRHPPYSFILAMDAEHRQAMMELPLFFQPNSSDRPGTAAPRAPPSQDPKTLVQYYEKIMLNLAIHSRMLRLHRPWLSKGYTDERFAYSKEQCIRAARASLRMMSDTHGTAAFLEKWWLPLFYVSVSGLVVIIDLLLKLIVKRTNRRDMHSTETEQKISEVRGALDQMRQISDVSHPSRAAVKVMEFLLAEVEERRRPPGSSAGKRKAPDNDEADGLQRAVKKLIRQAQLEVESPLTSMSTASGTPASLPPVSTSPRDRPVFDAYPLPPPNGPADGLPPETVSGSAAVQSGNDTFFPVASLAFNPTSSAGTTQPAGQLRTVSNPTLVPAPNPYTSMSPFAFPLDPNTGNAFPAFLPSTTTPQLDPSVEDLLANYFPTSGQNVSQNQSWGTVPDDFLSRVFSFSWENGNPASIPTGQMQPQAEAQHNVPPHVGSGQPRASSMDQGHIASVYPAFVQGEGMGAPVTRPGEQAKAPPSVPVQAPSGRGNGMNPALAVNQQQQNFGGVDPLSIPGAETFVPFDWGTGSGGWMA